MDPSEKTAGWLSKKGDKGLFKGFSRRWFQYLGGGIIQYADEPAKIITDPNGKIILDSVTGVTVYNNTKDPSLQKQFEINTNTGRVYILQADTESEMNKWINLVKAYQQAKKENFGAIPTNLASNITPPQSPLNNAAQSNGNAGKPALTSSTSNANLTSNNSSNSLNAALEQPQRPQSKPNDELANRLQELEAALQAERLKNTTLSQQLEEHASANVKNEDEELLYKELQSLSDEIAEFSELIEHDVIPSLPSTPSKSVSDIKFHSNNSTPSSKLAILKFTVEKLREESEAKSLTINDLDSRLKAANKEHLNAMQALRKSVEELESQLQIATIESEQTKTQLQEANVKLTAQEQSRKTLQVDLEIALQQAAGSKAKIADLDSQIVMLSSAAQGSETEKEQAINTMLTDFKASLTSKEEQLKQKEAAILLLTQEKSDLRQQLDERSERHEATKKELDHLETQSIRLQAELSALKTESSQRVETADRALVDERERHVQQLESLKQSHAAEIEEVKKSSKASARAELETEHDEAKRSRSKAGGDDVQRKLGVALAQLQEETAKVSALSQELSEAKRLAADERRLREESDAKAAATVSRHSSTNSLAIPHSHSPGNALNNSASNSNPGSNSNSSSFSTSSVVQHSPELPTSPRATSELQQARSRIKLLENNLSLSQDQERANGEMVEVLEAAMKKLQAQVQELKIEQEKSALPAQIPRPQTNDDFDPLEISHILAKNLDLEKQFSSLQADMWKTKEGSEIVNGKYMSLTDEMTAMRKAILEKDQNLFALQSKLKQVRELESGRRMPENERFENMRVQIVAHQTQNATLMQMLERLETDKKISIEANNKVMSSYQAEIESWMTKFHALLHSCLLEDGNDALLTENRIKINQKITRDFLYDFEELKKKYFLSLWNKCHLKYQKQGIAMNLPSGDDLYEKGKNISWKSYEAWIENQLQDIIKSDVKRKTNELARRSINSGY